MYGRHFLTLKDFTAAEFKLIIDTAVKIKAEHKKGKETPLLKGKSLAMIFQKPSNRTRVSFEVGMFQLAGQSILIKPEEIQMGQREPIADVAEVLSRYVNGVMMRVIRHTDILTFAEHSSVPVINGLSDLFHPCQAVSDILTILEHKKSLKDRKVCYIGDGNNVCNSLIIASKLAGIEMVVSCPKGYEPTLNKDEFSFTIDNDPYSAAKGADVIYTDVWVSMGQEDQIRKKRKAFENFTVNKEMMQQAKADAIFLHCLPAHRGEEVDSEVFDSAQSVVFDQAENRMHAQKAILALLMSKDLA